MNFEAVIGLEIHVEMKTLSKMFSSAPVEFGAEPNSLCAPLDLAFPGTMPVVNRQAVINAIRVSNALHMEIDHELWFDRKNYFYSDLPKGYQITQNNRPIGKNGYLEITVDGEVRHLEIERLHMEEDTCKQLHMADFTLLDYNRAGTPLIEIVSRPVIRNGIEAALYVETIRQIVVYSDVSDGKMEEGSLRCDVNISLRPCGQTKLGTKVEIKNLNSIANIEKAIDFEMKRQESLLLSGVSIIQETRRFDETKKETVTMRVKTDAVDYKYFVEPNITPIELSNEFISNAIKTCPELAESKKNRYVSEFGLTIKEADILLLDKDVSSYFDEVTSATNNYKVAANWVMGDVTAYLNKESITISAFAVYPARLATLIKLIEKGELSNKQAREVFLEMAKFDIEPEEAKNKLGITSQVSDNEAILKIINEVLNEFPQSIDDYKNGKDRAVGFLVGQIMKKSGGKVNPGLTSKLLVEELKKK